VEAILLHEVFERSHDLLKDIGVMKPLFFRVRLCVCLEAGSKRMNVMPVPFVSVRSTEMRFVLLPFDHLGFEIVWLTDEDSLCNSGRSLTSKNGAGRPPVLLWFFFVQDLLLLSMNLGLDLVAFLWHLHDGPLWQSGESAKGRRTLPPKWLASELVRQILPQGAR
jgi:hypothetical protein